MHFLTQITVSYPREKTVSASLQNPFLLVSELFSISHDGVSVKRGLGVGVGVGVFFFLIMFFSFFFFYVFLSNPISISRNLHQQCVVTIFLGYEDNEMRWSSFVQCITANNPSHILVKTIEYGSCRNIF